jgi:hypothetical protein
MDGDASRQSLEFPFINHNHVGRLQPEFGVAQTSLNAVVVASRQQGPA